MGLSIMLDTMKLPENVREYFAKQGRIGAAKRTATLTPERRQEIARIAAEARWKKAKESPKKSAVKKP
jgi:hypothetical protein